MSLPRFALDLLALPPEASSVSKGIDALHATVISISLVGALGVALLVARYVIANRQRGTNEVTPRIESSPKREIALGTAIFALFAAFWVVGFRQYVRIESPPDDCMTVYVTAKQWMWELAYDDGTSEQNLLVVPVGKAVKLVMTSRDVIHSFYVPAFRLKQDVLPGRYVTLWFQATELGDFDIFCAEYCGTSHSNMHGIVRVVSASDFDAWKARARSTLPDTASLANRGAAIAARKQCFACHSVDGSAKSGPSWRNLYGSTQMMRDGRQVRADEAYLAKSILDPNADRVAGYANEMPSYTGILDADEVSALVAYVRSLRKGEP
ncbi:MAG: cytochrome c oxidase subunit II [Polyangiaceae bacterium]